jgi:hypothetical protein
LWWAPTGPYGKPVTGETGSCAVIGVHTIFPLIPHVTFWLYNQAVQFTFHLKRHPPIQPSDIVTLDQHGVLFAYYDFYEK